MLSMVFSLNRFDLRLDLIDLGGNLVKETILVQVILFIVARVETRGHVFLQRLGT